MSIKTCSWMLIIFLTAMSCQNNRPTLKLPEALEDDGVCHLLIESSSTILVEKTPTRVPDREFRRLQLALAQVCASEAGFQTRTFDCLLIYETLRYRAESGELTMGIMRAYSTAAFDTTRTDSRLWLPYLNSKGSRPRGWAETSTIPWSAIRRDWLSLYEYAGHLLSHLQSYPCPLQVHHWGARGFRYWSHVHEGWIPVECGETANQFWHVPSRNYPETRICRVSARVCSL